MGENTGEMFSLPARGEDQSTGILESSENLVVANPAGVQFYQSLQHSAKKCFRPDIIIIINIAFRAINKHREI